MATGYLRGHEIYFDYIDYEWKYTDTNKIADDSRPCKQCNCYPTKDGYDACIGYVEGATSVCCGHGVSTPILIKSLDKT